MTRTCKLTRPGLLTRSGPFLPCGITFGHLWWPRRDRAWYPDIQYGLILCYLLVSSGFGWNNNRRQYAIEASSGVDRLDYDVYAEALAGLFSTGEADVLPAAVGIYARWGAGKVRTPS